MSVNLLGLLQDQLGNVLVDQASSFLGENASGVSKAVSGILPGLLGSLVSKGSTQSGAAGILDMIAKGGHDGSALSNLSGLFSGGSSTTSLLKTGSQLIGGLMNDQQSNSMIDMISGFAGIKKSSSSSLMSMLAPMLLGVLGKQVKSRDMNASSLMNFLGSQAEHASSAMPSELAGLRGVFGLSEASKARGGANANAHVEKRQHASGHTATRTSTAAKKEEKKKGGFMKILLPLLLLLGLLGLGYWLLTGKSPKEGAKRTAGTVVETTKGAGNAIADGAGKAVDATKGAAGTVTDAAKGAAGTVADGASKAVDATKGAAGTVVDATKDAAGKVADGASKAVDATKNAAQAGLSKIKFTPGSAGDQLSKLGASGTASSTIRFKNMGFEEKSARFTGAAKAEMDNLVSVLKAYPDYKLDIEEYTGKKTLATLRAKAIKTYFTKNGIDGSRIKAMGKGEGAGSGTVAKVYK